MQRLNYPLWIIKQAPGNAGAVSGHVLAFSTPASAFDRARGPDAEHCELLMVTRARMPVLIGELQKVGFVGLLYDPKPDGTGGTLIPFEGLSAE